MALRLSTAPAEKTAVEDYLSRVRSIAPVIAASSDRIESDRRLPPELLDALHGAGMFRLLLPKPFGGGEVDPGCFHQVISEVAQYDASTAWCLGQGNGCAMTAAYLEPEVANEIWGRDPRAVLAWGPGKAQIVEEGDTYRVNGSWAFASGMRHATWLGAHSIEHDAKGNQLKDENGKPIWRTALFPSDVPAKKDIWNVIGLRGTASDGYEVKDLVVDRRYTLHRDDPETRRHETPLYQFPATALYSIGFSGTAIGIARSMLESFKELAGEKTPRRLPGVLRDNGVVQMEVGIAEARLTAARAYILSEIDDIWSAVLATGQLTVPQRMRIRLMTTHGIHEAKAVGDAVYDLAGATAIFASNVFERRFRDLHTVRQQVQGRKMNIQSVGSFLLGNAPDMSVI
jgi:alkylation response protein AidB-like acyl-CoA dehydrogenase